MKTIFLIVLTAVIIAIISGANLKQTSQLKSGITIGDPCQTYQNQSGICTKNKRDCKDDLFKKLILTRGEIRLIQQSKCGKYGFCCALKDSQHFLLPNSNECGQTVEDRILGGNLTELSAYPWMALLKFVKLIDKSIHYSCGGSLINERYVLTAAHCFHVKGFRFMNELRLGEWDLRSEPDCYFRGRICTDKPLNIIVEQIIQHLNFILNPAPINDIALLRLSRKITYTDYIKPICLPIDKRIIGKNFNEIQLNVAGWGVTETGRSSDKKLVTKVAVVINSKCDAVFESRTKMKLNNQTQMCAGGDGVHDSCQGDSGGSLMYHDLDAEYSPWIAVGIVSYGLQSCAKIRIPAVYTRVDGYLKWILSNIH